MENIVNRLKNKVVVSVQAMPSEPLYLEKCMAAMMNSAPSSLSAARATSLAFVIRLSFILANILRNREEWK